MSAQLGLTSPPHPPSLNINALHTQSFACFWGLAFLPADPFHHYFALFPFLPSLSPPLPRQWSDRMGWLADYICNRFIIELCFFLIFHLFNKTSLSKNCSESQYSALHFYLFDKRFSRIIFSKLQSVSLLIQSAADLSGLCVNNFSHVWKRLCTQNTNQSLFPLISHTTFNTTVTMTDFISIYSKTQQRFTKILSV